MIICHSLVPNPQGKFPEKEEVLQPADAPFILQSLEFKALHVVQKVEIINHNSRIKKLGMENILFDLVHALNHESLVLKHNNCRQLFLGKPFGGIWWGSSGFVEQQHLKKCFCGLRNSSDGILHPCGTRVFSKILFKSARHSNI